MCDQSLYKTIFMVGDVGMRENLLPTNCFINSENNFLTMVQDLSSKFKKMLEKKKNFTRSLVHILCVFCVTDAFREISYLGFFAGIFVCLKTVQSHGSFRK